MHEKEHLHSPSFLELEHSAFIFAASEGRSSTEQAQESSMISAMEEEDSDSSAQAGFDFGPRTKVSSGAGISERSLFLRL